MRRHLTALVRLAWEIPLSIGSWLFFRMMRFLLARLYTFGLSRMTSEAHDWKVFSRDTLEQPFVLPIVATKGPRWNTHAVIVTAGPLQVRRTLSFDAAAAFASAESWSFVIYSNPRYDTVASIESFSVGEGSRWHTVELQPGRYSINLRYYGLSDDALAPAVDADGETIVPPKRVPAGSNRFYSDLRRRRDGWFFAALHYYVFHMLRFRRWLPAAFVRREFLPVGDPGTIFRYGFIRAGECLDVVSDARLLENYDLYLTVYNRSSFPVDSRIVRERAWRSEAVAADGFYLFRIRRRPIIAEAFREEWLQTGTRERQAHAVGQRAVAR